MTTFPNNATFKFIEYSPLPYNAYPADVAAVLDSVVRLFSMYFNDVRQHPLTVKCNYPKRESPETVYEINTIYLNISPFTSDGYPGCYWSQFIYQFSHEFCHYMNWGHVVQSMRWFEETLCELASHFFLIKSAEQWVHNAPYPNWNSYSGKLLAYELNSRNEVEPFDISDLLNPSSKIIYSLKENEYQRSKNRYIALKLLPLFEQNPALWKIVPFLPDLDDNRTFLENLKLLGHLSNQSIYPIIREFQVSLK